MTQSTPLRGRCALITGVSRRKGIGYGIAVHLAELGADIFIQHYSPHDRDQPWGADDLSLVRDGIRAAQHDGASFGDTEADLTDPARLPRLLDAAAALNGRVDILVCNHARSGGDGSIFDMTPENLDAFWHTNTRSTLLLTRYFAERFAPAPPTTAATPGQRQQRTIIDEHSTGRVIWMTSGQQDHPMRGEVAYATSKAALAGVTPTVAAELLARGIVLNTVNPGPVNTGYLDPETTDRDLTEVAGTIEATPYHRFGAPDDPARLIGWLVSDAGRWVTGQVIKSDGGFDLWR